MNSLCLFILSVLFIQLSFQQGSLQEGLGPVFIYYTLDSLEAGAVYLVGYGSQGLQITPEGEFLEGWQDLMLELERVSLNNAEGEWIYEWVYPDGEVYKVIDENGHMITVSDHGYYSDDTELVAAESGLSVSELPDAMDSVFASVIYDVYVRDPTIESISAAEAHYLGLTGA